MSKSCDICGKKPSFGNTVSHANNRHSRRWFPNLQNVHAVVSGRPMKLSVCTGCLKAGKVTKKVRGQNKRPAPVPA